MAANTMVRPLQESRVGSGCDPLKKLVAELQEVLRTGNITALAVAGPPKRLQSHDDEDPQVVRPYEFGTIFGIWSAAQEEGRERDLTHYAALGAVVVTPGSTWILVNPEWATNPAFMDRFREACEGWGRESIRRLNEQMAQQFPRRKRKRAVLPDKDACS